MVAIEKAKSEDLGAVVRITEQRVRRMEELYGQARSGFDERSEKQFYASWREKEGVLFLVAREEGRVRGFVTAELKDGGHDIYPSPYCEVGFLTAETSEGSRALLEAAENWGRERKAPLIVVSSEARFPEEAALLRDRKYAPAQTEFTKVL